MNICEWIDRWAAETPDKPAILFEATTTDYRRFAETSFEYADRLVHQLGVRPGDRVAYLGKNSADFLFLLFACARIGAVISPLNWRLARPELENILDDASPKVVIAEEDMQAGWADAVCLEHCSRIGISGVSQPGWRRFLDLPLSGCEVATKPDCAEDALLLVYTSGTTGRPKGVLLSHRAVETNARNSVAMHRLDARDHALVSLPFFHVGGLNILTSPIFHVGGTVTVHRAFDPRQTVAALASGGPTRAAIVSAQMPAILELPQWDGADFSNLASVTTGAGPVSSTIYEKWREKNVPVLQVYGATETCPIAIHTNFEDAENDIVAAGRAAAHCRVRIVDANDRDVAFGEVGEIWLQGANVMSGYWQNEAETRDVLREGWYMTGDIGYCDESGLYHVGDRKKDMIISGGENIYPAELETILMDCPAIAEAAIIGLPEERWGEVPQAIVKMSKGQFMTGAEVLGLFAGRLARYKHPKHVVFVDDFPRNALGKIQKFELRKRHREVGS